MQVRYAPHHLLRLARSAVGVVGGTSADLVGPAYRKGAPFRDRLCPRDEPGDPLVVEGAVRDLDGRPLPGALLDVWQADARGPRHVHFLVVVEGRPPLVTQLYFAGDEKLKGRHAKRVGNVRPIVDGRVRFDLVLEGAS